MAHRSSLGPSRWQITAILTLFFSAVAGAAAIGWWYARDSPPHQGPILLIAADGLPHELPTADPASTEPVQPGLAALVADSVVFDRAYAHSPLLLPAYASLIAGQLPFDHGVRDEGGFVLAPQIRTLAELLRNRGFSTGASVSSTLLVNETGVAQGFSFYDAAHPAEPPALTAAEPTHEIVGASRSGEATIEAAEAWARAQEDQRYVLIVQVDGAEAEMAVTRLTALLRESGSYDRATIVLIGTRGQAAGGAALDELSLRVPFLIKQPDQAGAGRRIADPVQHVDVLPTLLDLVRAPIPGGLRGRSLETLLTDQDGRIDPQPIYAESLAAYFRLGGSPLFALTVQDLRYVRGASETLERLGPTQGEAVTFDADPFAEGAPASDMAPLRATLDRLLGGAHIEPASALRAADRERLARAGYLAGLPRLPSLVSRAPVFDTADQQAALAAHQTAARLLGARNHAGAVSVLRGLARAHPELPDLQYQIGAIAARMGNPQEAVAAFRVALALSPDSAEIVMALAGSLAQAGQLDDAAVEGARAVALASERDLPVRVAAHELAARLALARQDPESALAHATAAQAMDSSLPMQTLVEAGIAEQAGDDETALRRLQEAAAVLQQHQSALEGVHLRLAAHLARLDRADEAIAAYEAEIRAYPESAAAYAGLANLYRRIGQPETAETVLEALVQRVPTRDGYAAAVRAWTASGRRARADALRSEARARLRPLPVLALPARGAAR